MFLKAYSKEEIIELRKKATKKNAKKKNDVQQVLSKQKPLVIITSKESVRYD